MRAPSIPAPVAARSRCLPLLAVISCLLVGPAHAAALYKWIDEDGQVRYSDRLPASQAKRKHHQLNSQGVVVNTTEDARSKEDLAAEAEAKRKQEEADAEAARLKAIQDKKDQVLLLTFSSEEELGLARDNRIDVIDSVIRLIEKSITSTQEKLDQLMASAETNFISQGKEVPGGLAQKIEHFTRKIESRGAQLKQKIEEKHKINQQFEHDLARFRELKSENDESQTN